MPERAYVKGHGPVRGIVVTSGQHYLTNQPAYREHLHDPEVPTAVLYLSELEHALYWTLLGEPSEVFAAITEWYPENGIDLKRPLRDWFDQHALTVTPPNPILLPAWDAAHAWGMTSHDVV